MAVFFTDDRVAALRLAQSRRVPHVSISRGVNEIGPEVAAYMQDPDAAVVVLGTEWLVGATTVPTLEFAKSFGRVDHIRIGALLDEEEAYGPAAGADLERQTKTMPAALARRDGAFIWRVDDDAKGTFYAVDGTLMGASALSPFDVVGLAPATGAPNVTFDLAIGSVPPAAAASRCRPRSSPNWPARITMAGRCAPVTRSCIRKGRCLPRG